MPGIKTIVKIIRYAIMISIMVSIISGLGLAPFLGCYFRYGNSAVNSTQSSVILYAQGILGVSQVAEPNPTYGQWQKVNLDIKQGSSLYFTVEGELSLCQATYAGDSTKIIPRTDSDDSFKILLTASSTSNTITEVYQGDLLTVKIGESSSSNPYSVYLSNGSQVTANCSDGQSTYSPICGKYSYYSNLEYTKSCISVPSVDRRVDIKGTSGCSSPGAKDDRDKYKGYTCAQTNDRICQTTAGISGATIDECRCYAYSCYKFFNGILNTNYTSSAIFLKDAAPFINDSSGINSDYTCPSSVPPDTSKTWFSFQQVAGKTTAGGLRYYISNSNVYDQDANIIDNCSSSGNASTCHNFSDRYLFDNTNAGGMQGLSQTSGNLVYHFLSIPSYQNSLNTSQGQYTGGYVIYVKQTKCRRVNGVYGSDPGFNDRGAIKYLILDQGVNPNSSTTYSSAGGNIDLINGDNSLHPITANNDGVLWLRINNKTSDYPNSVGSYQVDISQNITALVNNDFDLWTWVNNIFTNTFNNLAINMFKNLTCYNASNQSNCINLFNIIRAFLVAYIAIFGIMLSIGALQMDYYDFIIRIIKVVIIGGLVTGQTFNFFNTYVFNLVFGFTNSLMNSAIFFPTSGSTGNGLGNFLSTIFTTLGQDIFQIQLLAMLGTGFTGIINFILILISLLLFLLPILNLMVVSLVSYFFVSVLIGLAPIFLIFLLFNSTRYLFDAWVKHLISYLFEPVILFIGIAILAKIFLIYLDYVLGYSVCFKCNAAFSIPFLTSFFPFLTSILETMPVFCIYWLSPWGYDTMSFNYGLALTNVISLFCIGNAIFSYTRVCGQVISSIFGGSPSSDMVNSSLLQHASSIGKKVGQTIKAQIKKQ